MKRNAIHETNKRQCIKDIRHSLKRCLEDDSSSSKKHRCADYYDGYSDGLREARLKVEKQVDTEVSMAVSRIILFYETEIATYNLATSFPKWVS